MNKMTIMTIVVTKRDIYKIFPDNFMDETTLVYTVRDSIWTAGRKEVVVGSNGVIQKEKVLVLLINIIMLDKILNCVVQENIVLVIKVVALVPMS